MFKIIEGQRERKPQKEIIVAPLNETLQKCSTLALNRLSPRRISVRTDRRII